MAAKLTALIPQQNFELVRDRIALILSEELENQRDLGMTELEGMQGVWVGRVAPFQEDELPAVNVTLDNTAFENQSMVSVTGQNLFYIDVYTRAKATDDADADKLADRALDRIVGAICAILRFPDYRTLNFAPPSLGGTKVTRFSKGLSNPDDANSSKAARIEFMVQCPETTELNTAVDIASHYTTVKLAETDKGYLWIWEADVTYIITEDEKFIVSESGNARFIKEN